jgi:hypothetical protein
MDKNARTLGRVPSLKGEDVELYIIVQASI